MPDQPEPLNAAQLSAAQKAIDATIRRVLTDVELRKHALAAAVRVAKGSPLTPPQFMDLAQEMYGFLLAGTAQEAPRTPPASA